MGGKLLHIWSARSKSRDDHCSLWPRAALCLGFGHAPLKARERDASVIRLDVIGWKHLTAIQLGGGVGGLPCSFYFLFVKRIRLMIIHLIHRVLERVGSVGFSFCVSDCYLCGHGAAARRGRKKINFHSVTGEN